jgi:hypothetical protein
MPAPTEEEHSAGARPDVHDGGGSPGIPGAPSAARRRRRIDLLWSVAAGGLAGVKRAIDIFVEEIDLVMGQIGCPSLDQLGPDFLWRDDRTRNR